MYSHFHESIHQRLASSAASSSQYASSDMYGSSNPATSTTRSSFSTSVAQPQSPWADDFASSDLKMDAFYENPYDYLSMAGMSGPGELDATQLEAFIATGMLDGTTASSALDMYSSQAEYGYPYLDNAQPPMYDQVQQSPKVPQLPQAPQMSHVLHSSPVQSIVPRRSIQMQSPPPQPTPTLPMQDYRLPTKNDTLERKRAANKYALADFVFHHTLGTGSFGRVHLVQSRHNMRFYAIKVLAKEKVVKLKQVEHTNSERQMLSETKHGFLVNLWGTFQDSKNLYMVMDFVAGGELFTLIRKSTRFPSAVAKFYAAEVALALEHLHSQDIIYRDLKPENILIAQDGHIKLTDFGFAKRVKDKTYTLCGTPDYLAPEVVQQGGYNKSVDWYAWGVLIFEMLVGYPPFYSKDTNPVHLYEKIVRGVVDYPKFIDYVAKDLISNCLSADLSIRYGNKHRGSQEIFRHSWFAEVDWEMLRNKEIPAPYQPDLRGDGDSSQFEAYDENDTSEYGTTGPDPYADLFGEFA